MDWIGILNSMIGPEAKVTKTETGYKVRNPELVKATVKKLRTDSKSAETLKQKVSSLSQKSVEKKTVVRTKSSDTQYWSEVARLSDEGGLTTTSARRALLEKNPALVEAAGLLPKSQRKSTDGNPYLELFRSRVFTAMQRNSKLSFREAQAEVKLSNTSLYRAAYHQDSQSKFYAAVAFEMDATGVDMVSAKNKVAVLLSEDARKINLNAVR